MRLISKRNHNTPFFISNARLELAKNQTNAKQFCYLKIILIPYPNYHPKIIGNILKSKQKNKCVYIHEFIWLNIMKMKMKINNRLHIYDINRPRSRYGYKYSKYVSLMMLICIKENLSNIWSSIHEKNKQHWGWVEKKALLIKLKHVTVIPSFFYKLVFWESVS